MMGACLSELVRLQRFSAWRTKDLKARRVEFGDDGSMFIRVGGLQRFSAWRTEDLKARRVEFDDDGSMFIRVGSSSEVLGVSDLQCIVTFMCVLILHVSLCMAGCD